MIKMMFYKETNFKETPIGKIPKDWEVVRLKDISDDIYYGITAKATKEKTNLRILRTTDIKEYKVNWDSLQFCKITEKRRDLRRFFLEQGDLIIARAGTAGVSIIVDRDLENVIFGSYLIKVKLSKKVFPKFMYYFCQSSLYWNHIISSQAGSTLKNISLPVLYSLNIPLPPLPEQQKIAEILSTVDEAIQKTNEIIAKTERLKKGLMQELLTKGIGHKEFKDTEIGRIPKDWEVVRLEEILELKNGKRPKLTENGNIPVYGANGIMGYTSTFLVSNDFTLIIGRVGAPGEIYIGQGKIWVSDNAIYSKKYNSSRVYLPFLFYMLKFRELKKFSSKTTHPIITQNFLKQYKVSLPPLPEQQKIAEILSTVDKKLEIERNRKRKLERIKQGLMDLLLTGKIRVKVDYKNKEEMIKCH
ncbi:MAG: restriction endonuclease subunit S [Candidatus Aenigmatarchaeota archaeon]